MCYGLRTVRWIDCVLCSASGGGSWFSLVCICLSLPSYYHHHHHHCSLVAALSFAVGMPNLPWIVIPVDFPIVWYVWPRGPKIRV
jgi:hypothetical protein